MFEFMYLNVINFNIFNFYVIFSFSVIYKKYMSICLIFSLHFMMKLIFDNVCAKHRLKIIPVTSFSTVLVSVLFMY